MTQGLDYGNLLAFVEIVIAFNGGLIFLKQNDNVLNKIGCSFLRFTEGIVRNFYEEASDAENFLNRLPFFEEKKLQEMIDRMNLEVKKIKPLLENVVNKSNMSYLYSCIPYLGLYSGIYGLAFLLIIGLLGWCLDDFLKDYILVLGEVVGFWEALTMAYLYYHYKCVNDNMSDDKKQYFFFANIAWFIFFVFIATLVTVLGWVIPFYSDFDTPLLLSLLVVCFPIIVLAIFAVYRFILVIYCQLKGHSALMVIRELRCKIEELLYAD